MPLNVARPSRKGTNVSGRRRKSPSGGTPDDGPLPRPVPPRQEDSRDTSPFAPRPPGQERLGAEPYAGAGRGHERREPPGGRQVGPYGSGLRHDSYIGPGLGRTDLGGAGLGRSSLNGPGLSGYGAGRSEGSEGSGGAGGSGDAEPGRGLGPAPGSGSRRVIRPRTLIGPLAGALGLAILLGAGVYALTEGHGCAEDAIRLNVAVAPEIAPAVENITTSFDNARHFVDDRCVQATVKASDPVGMTTVLSGGRSVPGEIDPDVWIPDSSLWVALVGSTGKGASSVRLTPTSVARTPIVVATTRTFAARIRDQGIRPTWDMILKATGALPAGTASRSGVLAPGSVHLQILDPDRNAAGIGAVVMTRMLLRGEPNADSIFTQIVRDMRNGLSPTPQALFGSFHRDLHGRAPMLVVPEQAVWRFDHAGPSVPASAMYPGEGLLSLDYPFTLATDDDAKIRAAGLLEQAMTTPQARASVRALGFRTPDGRPGDGFTAADGLSPRIPRALPAPVAGDVTDVMRAWSRLSPRTRKPYGHCGGRASRGTTTRSSC